MPGRTRRGLLARGAVAVAVLCATTTAITLTVMGRCGGGPALARNSVTIVTAGDVLLDRGVRKAIEERGIEALLSGAERLFREADIGLVNLECPATSAADPAAKRFVFRAEPEWLGPLRETGVTDVCLANNHTLDQGLGGLGDTIEAALEAGLGVVGAERSFREARIPLVRRFGSASEASRQSGIAVALLAYNLFPQEGVVFDPDLPWVCSFDPETIRGEIEAAREAANVVAVSFHWGKEYSSEPGPAQVDLARRACDWGADLVLGHHPHVIQGVEVYYPTGGPQGKISLIAYSLGNFVFDQGGVPADAIGADCGAAVVRSTSETFALRIEAGKAGLVSAEVIPVIIDDCSPVAAAGEDANRILKRIATLSQAFSTSIRPNGLVDLPAPKRDSRQRLYGRG